MRRRILLVLRRGHLYTGLFLMPWTVLYAVTAFLFNHPAALPDQPTVNFGRGAVAGTALEAVPSPTDTAAAVAAELTRRGHPVELLRPETARFNRDAAFATVKADGQTVSVLVDALTGTGTIRGKPDNPPPPPLPPAPFAVTGTPASPGRATPPADPVRTPDPLHERIRAALPTVLGRCGFPAGPVVVTSTPDVVFDLRADGREWQATYSPLTGSVTGVPTDAVPAAERTTRQYLLKLHKTHGYPAAADARWWWAVVVDVMAFVMLFWAASGVIMWWQIKATRRLGVLALAASGVVGGWLATAMYSLFTR